MVDQEKIAKYLLELERYAKQLNELKKCSRDKFLSDWKIHDLAERELHLALEAYLTIGEIIISEKKFRKPDTYAEIPRILFENNIIDSELKEKLIDLARFRNILVHEYAALDHEIVYDKLQNIPAVISDYLKTVKSYLSGA
ncbi:MAG: DUF86 domain-containing protein [Candidatus Omnitrophota bacterium]